MSDSPFRFSTTLEVIWRDLDALGHVNNAVYFTYLEYARMKYLQELGLGFRDRREAGIILAEACCTYHSPLALGERVTIWVRVSEMRRSSFVLEYRMEGNDGRLVATARTVQVCYDYAAGHPVPIPDQWRAAITAYEPYFREDA
ncbi:MAG: thioesterase family protein [Anaerolineae bacterium]|nr:acyl-CoA thioesterase [Anaerolineae bacterium]MDW8069695.1 thioesterase family protein [Anaerolineae bacterium]